MKFTKVFWITVLLVILSSSTLQARVRPVPLAELASKSEAVVIGKVISVAPIDGGRIAWLEVTQTLKGNSQLKRLAFWASPTWACDISTANEGETVLLLLSRASASDLSELAKEHPSLDSYLKNNSTNGTLFFINESGGGRMVITNDILERNDYVIYPREIQVVERRPLKYGHQSFSLLNEVVRFIQSAIPANK